MVTVKPSRLQEIIKAALRVNIPLIIWGKPGIGKTEMVHAGATEESYGIEDERLPTMEPVDIRGLPFTQNGTMTWSRPYFLHDSGKWVLFLDELTAAPRAMQVAAYQLIQERRVGPHVLGPDVRIIAAGNNEGSGAIVERMSSALSSRMLHVTLEPDVGEWVDWAFAHNLPMEVIGYLRWKPAHLHLYDPTKAEKSFACPRTWKMVADLLTTYGPAWLQYDVISGVVGEAVAAEFLGFVKLYGQLPDPDAILLAPDTAPIPTEPSALYAVCGAIGAKATQANIERLVVYANRLPPAFSVLTIRDALRHDQKIVNNQAFARWAQAHKDVLL